MVTVALDLQHMQNCLKLVILGIQLLTSIFLAGGSRSPRPPEWLWQYLSGHGGWSKAPAFLTAFQLT